MQRPVEYIAKIVTHWAARNTINIYAVRIELATVVSMVARRRLAPKFSGLVIAAVRDGFGPNDWLLSSCLAGHRKCQKRAQCVATTLHSSAVSLVGVSHWSQAFRPRLSIGC